MDDSSTILCGIHVLQLSRLDLGIDLLFGKRKEMG